MHKEAEMYRTSNCFWSHGCEMLIHCPSVWFQQDSYTACCCLSSVTSALL